jgi:hypothetical protein
VHHGNFDALIAKPRDTSGPFSINGRPAFRLEHSLTYCCTLGLGLSRPR